MSSTTSWPSTAVITKMVRVMMPAPLLIILSAWLARHPEAGDTTDEVAAKPGRIVIPWFALVFVVVAGIHSLRVVPPTLVAHAIDVDTFALAMAMAALGLTTPVSAICTAGVRPLALAGVLFAWLVVGGFAINVGMTALIG